MKNLFFLIAALAVALAGCSESDQELPTSNSVWTITELTGETISGPEFPIVYQVSMSVQQIGMSGSIPASDGTVVAVTVSYPETGEQESMDVTTVDGIAAFELVFEQPGSADCTAKTGNTSLEFTIWILESGESRVT